MEQKKTLWIIAAVGIFLLVVFGAAMFIWAPTARKAPVIAKAPVVQTGTQYQNNGWTNNPPAETPVKESASANVQDMFVVSENTTVLGFDQPAASNEATTIDLNALKKELSTELQASSPVAQVPASQPQNINITVNIPESEKQLTVQAPVMVASDYYIQTQAPAKEHHAEVPPASANKPAAVASNNSKQTPVASTKTVVTNTTTISKTITRYWVQVAAYSNKKTAEGARTVLTEKKITSDIYTYQDAKDTLFYRVRVGPFSTKSEAEYWKSKIVEISDFKKAGSYVTSTVD